LLIKVLKFNLPFLEEFSQKNTNDVMLSVNTVLQDLNNNLQKQILCPFNLNLLLEKEVIFIKL